MTIFEYVKYTTKQITMYYGRKLPFLTLFLHQKKYIVKLSRITDPSTLKAMIKFLDLLEPFFFAVTVTE